MTNTIKNSRRSRLEFFYKLSQEEDKELISEEADFEPKGIIEVEDDSAIRSDIRPGTDPKPYLY